MRPRPFGPLLVAVLLGLASPALATTIVTLSTVSSDATDPSLLDAEFEFSVSGTTLTLTVTNTGSDFNINEIYFNASGSVTGLTLSSATHSVAGDVSAAWLPIELGSSPDGFGAFTFGLTDGVGETNDNIIEPGEDIEFVFAISGGGTYSDADFIVGNENGYTAAAKFVNGPDDPELPGDEDSAFGTVPEPLTAWLLAAGLAGFLAARRKRG
jgi:hypothetical protein